MLVRHYLSARGQRSAAADAGMQLAAVYSTYDGLTSPHVIATTQAIEHVYKLLEPEIQLYKAKAYKKAKHYFR